MTKKPTIASITRAVLSCVVLVFGLGSIGGDGCHPWWVDYKPPNSAHVCGPGLTDYHCLCNETFSFGTCAEGQDLCAVNETEAESTAAAREQRYSFAIGRETPKVECNCQPIYDMADDPGVDPQTTGSDVPQCSDMFEQMGTGGGPSALCHDADFLCEQNSDCCSGSCTLNACN